MPYPTYVQTVTVTNACSAWYANLRRNLLKTVDDYTTMENWEHMLKPVRFTVSSFTVSARILWKKMYQQYKEYESATWAMKDSEKRWAVFDRICGLHCSWCKSSQMKLNRRQNETSKNVIPKLRLVYFHRSFLFLRHSCQDFWRKNLDVFVVGHACTRWRDFMSSIHDFQ